MVYWIESYNCAEIKDDDLSVVDRTLVGAAICIVVSSTPRALSSVRALGLSPSVIDKIFCEAELPVFEWPFMRLPAEIWAALFRSIWFFGYSKNSETFQSARNRAKVAVDKLISLAAEKGSVLLVGHGIMNRLIAKELLLSGWSGPDSHKNHYWSTSVYSFAE